MFSSIQLEEDRSHLMRSLLAATVSRFDVVYLHVCVDQVHGLRLMMAEQTHRRHRVSLPVRPITEEKTHGQMFDLLPQQT